MSAPYFLRSSKIRRSPSTLINRRPSRKSRPVFMATAADALAAANAATTVIKATTARIDVIEQGQLTISTQLTALSTQL
jgi:hypothetical protein